MGKAGWGGEQRSQWEHDAGVYRFGGTVRLGKRHPGLQAVGRGDHKPHDMYHNVPPKIQKHAASFYKDNSLVTAREINTFV